MMDAYRNSGGFDMICSGRHKIEKPAEFAASLAVVTELNLDGLVVIGGDDSNTNAAVLAEYFEANGCKCKVNGAPKTIDGDLKVDPYIPISFGFDTACRTYSELIGNLSSDTLSSQKYWHFVRLMGRAASNIALECALQTRPNVCLISEEVEAKKMTLSQITQQLVNIIMQRSKDGKNYGLVLLPEGLIEFIPEFTSLIEEINDVLANGAEATEAAVTPLLTASNQTLFAYLPDNIKQQLLLDRDPHGNVQVAKIETERLLAQTVAMELAELKSKGTYNGDFTPQFHSYGYEGRCGLPSDFDATYCYALGMTVASMMCLGQNGMIASVTNLAAPVSEWACGGVPITMMCHMEKRHGHMKPVIKKALVELEGKPFKCFQAHRDLWASQDLYSSPGPIQFFTGSDAVELCVTLSLELLGKDSRVDVAAIKAAAAAQTHTIFGDFTFAPHVGSTADALFSTCQLLRKAYKPKLNAALADLLSHEFVAGQPTQCKRIVDRPRISSRFPLTYGGKLFSLEPKEGSGKSATTASKPQKIGVVFCGRPAPGGGDVLAGLFDAQTALGGSLVGFVGGTVGLVRNAAMPVDANMIESIRGQGGFTLFGRSEESIATSSFPAVLQSCKTTGLDALILMGGARTATLAGYLSEYLAANLPGFKVISVPVDMSGSLKDEFVEMTVGFDTSTKVAGQVVGNNATDGASAKKYYYFMRLMGQEPSHSALEVALMTKPNYVILAEEVKAKNLNLQDIVRSIADVVEARAKVGKNYGTVLIPEGLVDSIPELKLLMTELDAIFAQGKKEDKAYELYRLDAELINSKLTVWSRALLESLPDFMRAEMIGQRGSDTSLPLSQAETERLLAHFVDIELGYRKKQGTYKGTFSVVCSFIGYQARGALPSNFDVTYAYNLGYAAARVVSSNTGTGYLVCINNLKKDVSQWQVSAVPCTALMTCQASAPGKGKIVEPSVAKAIVDIHGPAYAALTKLKEVDADKDCYENPGPMQFLGAVSLVDSVPLTLSLESNEYLDQIKSLQIALGKIEEACRPGCPATLLQIATQNLNSLTSTIELVTSLQSK